MDDSLPEYAKREQGSFKGDVLWPFEVHGSLNGEQSHFRRLTNNGYVILIEVSSSCPLSWRLPRIKEGSLGDGIDQGGSFLTHKRVGMGDAL